MIVNLVIVFSKFPVTHACVKYYKQSKSFLARYDLTRGVLFQHREIGFNASLKVRALIITSFDLEDDLVGP